MRGSIRIDGPLAEQMDGLLIQFVQENALRGSVKVATVLRGVYDHPGKSVNRTTPYYDVTFEGTLDLLAGHHEKT